MLLPINKINVLTQKLIKKFVPSKTLQPKVLETDKLNLGNLKPLEKDVCIITPAKKTPNASLPVSLQSVDKALINKFSQETLRDLGGEWQRFSREEINGLIKLCKTDKELVIYLVDQKAPHYLRGFAQQGRFVFSDIKWFTELFTDNRNKDFKKFLIELIDAKTSDGKPLNRTSRIKNLMQLGTKDFAVAKNIADTDISADEVKNLFELIETNPQNYKDIVDSGLFDLIKQGRINHDILSGIGAQKTLSKAVLQDIRKIKNNETYVKTLPELADMNNIYKYTGNGEVFEYKSKLYINDNGNPVFINLTKEKFEELFPLIDSAYMRQGNIDDCWLISVLDALMSKPKGRAAVLKTIRQEGNDIIVQFGGSKKSIRFKDGNFPENTDDSVHAAKGLRLLEIAFAIHRKNGYPKGVQEVDALNLFKQNKVSMQRLDAGILGEAIDSLIGDNLTFKEIIKLIFTSFRDDILWRNRPEKLIKRYANSDESILTFYINSSKDKIKNQIVNIDDKYTFVTEHGYAIKGFDKKNGNIYFSNPWNTEVIEEVPLKKFLELPCNVVQMNLV